MGSAIIVILAGIFTIVCSAMDMNWFFNSRRARTFVKLFGRNGAKIFYIGIGAFLVVIGIIVMVLG